MNCVAEEEDVAVMLMAGTTAGSSSIGERSKLASRTHILVVDDDPSTGEALRLLLDTAGYSIECAANGRVALDYLRRKTPALILLDLSMPVMDGATFREHQLCIPSLARVPVILLSAERDAEERARRLGIEDFQRKPISFTRLVALIKKRLQSGGVRSGHRSDPAQGRARSSQIRS